MSGFDEWQAQDVMSEPVTVSPETTIGAAEALLEEHGFNGLPVVDAEGALVGWVTSLDLLAAFAFPEDEILPPFERVLRQPVSKVMTRDVAMVWPRTPLPKALAKLVDRRVKSLPVLDDDRLVGVLARHDVLTGLRRAQAGEHPPGAVKG